MISDKNMKKIEKLLGLELLDELADTHPDADLKDKLVKAEAAIESARAELEANPKFQALKDDLKALSEGMREVNKRQRAIIQYILHVLEGRAS